MKKAVLFGAGAGCARWLSHCGGDYDITGIVDNDRRKTGCSFFGHRVYSPESINKLDFDVIIITLNDRYENGRESIASIYSKLIAMGIEDEKIELQHLRYLPSDPRVVFLRDLSGELGRYGVNGAVAECGVFYGEFSAYINEYFPERTLYLLDTFDGFTEEHMAAETASEAKQWLERNRVGLATGDEFIVRLRCTNRSKVIIRKGAVPGTLTGLESESFAFVNLDMDLYMPQLAALRFFAPRMARGGVILLHDYFTGGTPGVRKAVDEFAEECNFTRVPIGDSSSIALMMKR